MEQDVFVYIVSNCVCESQEQLIDIFTQVLGLVQSIPNCLDSVGVKDSVSREYTRLDVLLVVC